VGWLAWDAYDREAPERWRALPLRERYNARSVTALALIAACIALYILAKVAS
jgi:hypothetical protein